MGFCSLWSSRISTDVRDSFPTERYRYNVSPSIGLLSRGGDVRNFLISLNAFWQSAFHSNFLTFFIALKKGRHFLAEQDMNLPSAVIHPFNFCNSFSVVRGFMLMIAFIFSGLALIPLCEIMKLRNFPAFTPNTHLSRLSLTLYSCSVSRTRSKSLKYSSYAWLLTMWSWVWFPQMVPIDECQPPPNL